MSYLPEKEIKKDKTLNPNRLIIASHSGRGKTQIAEGLPNNLILDFEDRSGHITAHKINFPRLANKENKPFGLLLKNVADELKEANSKKGDFVYDYLTFDTLSTFEPIIRDLATKRFNESNIGIGKARKKASDLGHKGLKSHQLAAFMVKDVVTELPEGAGYMWLFNAYREIMSWFDGTVRYCFLYMAHSKQGSMTRKDQDLKASDIDFLGKMRLDIVKRADACGFLSIDSQNPDNRILSFKVSEKDLVSKASAPHLYNQEIVISEYKDGKITYHWDKVFPGWV